MTRIFISYRREDTADVCGRIYDRMEARFGRQNVFKDVNNIPAGVDFRSYVQSALEQCDVVLVVIGARWLASADSQGQPRLFAANDFVRIEVEVALQLRKVIVPVLVNSATMPSQEALPPSIGALAYINASRVRPDPDFGPDCEALMATVGVYNPTPAAYSGASRAGRPIAPIMPPVTPRPPDTAPQRILRRSIRLFSVLSLLGWIGSLIYRSLPESIAKLTPQTALWLSVAIFILNLIAVALAVVGAARSRRFGWVALLLTVGVISWGIVPFLYALGGTMGPAPKPAAMERDPASAA